MIDPERLKAVLAALPSALARLVQGALTELAATAAVAARSRLPPGPMADSIAVSSGVDGAAVLTADAPAAVFVEYGTRAENAHPFLRPAAEQAAAEDQAALSVKVIAALSDALERS